MVFSNKPLQVDMNSAIAQNEGFTLIELMAVVSIVSILAVIAIPAYLDYVVRSKVSEGMVFVAEAKTSASEYYYSTKNRALNNADAGLADSSDYDKPGGFVKKLEITSGVPADGTITVTFKIAGSDADNKELQLIPSTAGNLMTWTCTSPATNGINVRQAPPNCRG